MTSQTNRRIIDMKTVLLAAVAALALSTAALAQTETNAEANAEGTEGGWQGYTPSTGIGVPHDFADGTLAQLRDQQFAQYYQQQGQQLTAQRAQSNPNN
jgi:hypothetical protein